jgi:hypothetical protein
LTEITGDGKKEELANIKCYQIIVQLRGYQGNFVSLEMNRSNRIVIKEIDDQPGRSERSIVLEEKLKGLGQVRPIPTGRFLVTAWLDNCVLEISGTGKTIHRWAMPGARSSLRTLDGYTIIAGCFGASGYITALSLNGQTAWSTTLTSCPSMVRSYSRLVSLGFD